MLIAILQLFLTAAACYGLWRFWRALDGRGLASGIITAGLLIRAFGSQLLFWISWLRLPIARSLQLGDGFWFFAVDGVGYLDWTRQLIRGGVKAILFIDATYPSHTFTQWLTVSVAAFGAVASTAILFNCAAYLATCALTLRIGPSGSDRARVFALAAIAFGPATILWSLQPLKDTFFVLLITALIAACGVWQKLWREAAPRRRGLILLCGAAMSAAVYVISGTRWYFGGIVAGASAIFLVLVANLPRPRLVASIIAAALFLILVQAFRLGGDADIPLRVLNAMNPRMLIQPRTETKTVTKYLASARHGFEATAGATSIAPGKTLVQPPPPAAAESAPAVAAAPPSPGLAVKIVSGAAAMFIPRVLAQRFGLVRIGGGRGFWFFADADTLVFDVVILFAFGYCVRGVARRERRVTPLFLLVALVFVATAGPMIYSVTNFGTLFRLRQMLYVLAALLPLTLDLPRAER